MLVAILLDVVALAVAIEVEACDPESVGGGILDIEEELTRHSAGVEPERVRGAEVSPVVQLQAVHSNGVERDAVTIATEARESLLNERIRLASRQGLLRYVVDEPGA